MVEINTSEEDGCQLIAVAGEIDASSSIELDNALKNAADKYKSIIVDLENLQYISSAGLGVFISYLEDLKKKDIKLVLFGLQDNVREVFDILGLQHLMDISVSKKEALERLNEV